MYSWDQYFYDICMAVSKRSKCLSRKLGSVITKNNYIVSTGYNGPPSGCVHCDDIDYAEYLWILKYGKPPQVRSKKEGKCPRQVMGFTSGEGLIYCKSSHAERNAIYTAAKLGNSVDGCSLYLNGVIPCFECCKAIINSGIKEVIVTKLEDYEHFGITGRKLLEEANIKLRILNKD